jgi:23S rRNA (adenine2503-C2)-methyltransferase
MSPQRKLELIGIEQSRLKDLFIGAGLEPFRARQVFHNLYGRMVDDFYGMTDLRQDLRRTLSNQFSITLPPTVRRTESLDATVKYLFQVDGNETVEAVFIPEEHRTTLCLSTQVGCSFRCKFCLTATLGFKRNLSSGEIVGQVMGIVKDAPRALGANSRLNLVFMGMGEPLLNYDHVMAAIRLLADPNGLAISPRRMTLSTAGMVPRIYDLAKEPVRPHLAISLNATTEEQRTALMPHNNKYSLASLMQACQDYHLPARERLTFEYVLLEGINDSDADARRLVRLLSGIRAKINLLALNEAPELPFRSSPVERISRFREYLASKNLSVFVRKPRGLDILAACGQLKREVEPAGVAGKR